MGTLEWSSGSSTCHFSTTPGTLVYYQPYTEKELSIVRQAVLEGRRKSEIQDLVRSADRPHPEISLLIKRVFGERRYPRTHVAVPHKSLRRAWRSAEDEILRRNYGSGKTARATAEELGRSIVSIKARTRRVILGSTEERRSPGTAPKSSTVRRRWTDEEDRQMEEQWKQGFSDKLIAEKLSLGSGSRVRFRRSQLGLVAHKKYSFYSTWTTANDDDLRRLCADSTLSLREVGQKLSPPRSRTAVGVRKTVLGLTNAKAKAWTASEDRELRQLREQGLDISEIVNALTTPRSFDGIRHRVTQLKLHLPAHLKPERRAWSTEEVQKMLEVYKSGNSVHEIAKIMGRSYKSVSMKLVS